MSLAIAYTIGGALAAVGVVVSLLYTGSALVTTAIGTLLPIVSDAGELRTRLGAHLLAAGAVGELGPVVLLTLLLSAQSTVHKALILGAFALAVVVVAVVTLRASRRTLPILERTLEHSSQLAVRSALVLIFALTLLAYRLGLDLLLGGFAAGMITRRLLRDHQLPAFESKLTAVAFGLFVPSSSSSAACGWTSRRCSPVPGAWPRSRCSSSCSWSSAARRRCCSTAGR